VDYLNVLLKIEAKKNNKGIYFRLSKLRNKIEILWMEILTIVLEGWVWLHESNDMSGRLREGLKNKTVNLGH